MCLQYMKLVKGAASFDRSKLSICTWLDLIMHVENSVEAVSSVNANLCMFAELAIYKFVQLRFGKTDLEPSTLQASLHARLKRKIVLV